MFFQIDVGGGVLLHNGVPLRIQSINSEKPPRGARYIHILPTGGPIELLDQNGNLCEGMGSNIFLVKDGRVMTPQARYVLAGVSRHTVIELAQKLGMSVTECDLDLYDAYTADEAFITSTSLCLCPVSSINGAPVGDGTMPGPVSRRLLGAYSELVGVDILGQYLSQLEAR